MGNRSLFLVLSSSLLILGAFAANEEPKTKNQAQVAVPFRPEAGKFPALENAHSYRGELVFVDHANRRGSLRIQGVGSFRRNEPHPFALLPYGMVRYHGAPADLRDIPLGTMMHVLAYLPPDPKNSAVPVLPINNKENTAGFRDRGTAPAENHILLLEDEPSYDLRTGKAWKLGEVVLQNHAGLMVATREPTQGSLGQTTDETMTFDASTRVWRGRECLGIEDLIAEGTWPAEGKKSLSPQVVQLGLTWKPTAGSVFNRFHIADIWIDDAAMQRATQRQTKAYEAFIRSRWMPAWIDAVEYGKFGRATVTVTLFGGMPPALYADFKKGIPAMMNGVEQTLKHTEGGTAGPSQMSARGVILDVTKVHGEAPIGSSGIQIRFETDLITEGLRPTRVVRLRPADWPDVHVPREEYINGGSARMDERFPTPAIFPKY